MEPQTPQASSPEAAPAPAPAEQIPDQAPVAAPEVAPVAPTPEKQTGAREGANQGPGTLLPTAAQPPVQQAPQPPPTQSTKDGGVVVNAPAVADDVDVIEKEWVDKAKEIVDKNKENPHTQSKEVNLLKADYMKKRYDKDIKVSDN